MGEGNGNGKAPVLGLGCGMSVFQKKLLVAQRLFAFCMIQLVIISVFQNLGSGCFFRSPAFFSESGGKFCRIEFRHFFPPKGGSRYGSPMSRVWE